MGVAQFNHFRFLPFSVAKGEARRNFDRSQSKAGGAAAASACASTVPKSPARRATGSDKIERPISPY